MCGPEFSDFETSIWQVYQVEDMVILGVNVAEEFDVVENFVETFGITFPVLLDETGEVYFTYTNSGLSPFPLDYVIDQDGVIRYIATEYNPEDIIQVVEELLGLAPPPPLTIYCLPLKSTYPEGGYLSFEITAINNTGSEIAEDSYELRAEYFGETSCSALIEPVFTQILTPGPALFPGQSILRFDVGPIPEGVRELNPIATRISSFLMEPEPQLTDVCCFSWRAVSYPTKIIPSLQP